MRHKKGTGIRRRAWFRSETGKRRRLDHDHLTEGAEVLLMTCFSGSTLSQNGFIQASVFSCDPSLSAGFLGRRVTSTPDYSSGEPLSQVGLPLTKASQKLTNQEAGRQHCKPRALARMQPGCKTNSPTGKRKTLIWDMKQERATG